MPMPEPIAPIESNPNANITPNIDTGFDAEFDKSFANMRQSNNNSAEKKIDAPVEVKNVEEKSAIEPIVESPKNETNKSVPKEDKDLPDPDQIGDSPSSKTSASSKEGWNALKNNYKKAHRLTQEKDEEISKLKAVIADKSSASQKEIDAMRAEKSELEKYRAMVDIQADPEFISKYDEPIKAHIQTIKGMIKSLGVTDEAIETGIDFNSNESLDRVINLISQHKDRFTAAKIENKIKDYLSLSDKRTETLEEQKKNYKDTLEKRKQEGFAKQSEGEGRMIKHLELKSSEKDKDGKPLIPFLQKMTAKENATQQEIDSANSHNALVESMGKKLQSVIKMKEPEQQAEIAIAAVASHWLMAQLKTANEELRKAKEELNKMAVVTTESPSRKPNNPTGRNGNHEPVDHDQALNQYFAKKR